MKRARRGSMAPLAYVMVLAVATALIVGLRQRTAELAFEDRTACRAQARWAAESAFSRARAELGAGRMPPSLSGQLSGAGEGLEVSYKLDVGRSGGAVVVDAEGACVKEGDRAVRATISAELRGGGTRWRVVEWSEIE